MAAEKMTFAVQDLGRDPSIRAELIRLNNENVPETSSLSHANSMIASARVATGIERGLAFLLAFDQAADFDGGHFRWFGERFETFLYIDRIVVKQGYRRLGLGRLLYEDLFRRAAVLGHSSIACEVNVRPPNPISDAFHAAFGFTEIGTAKDGDKTVRYLVRRG
jgi:uncharacterized protein